MNIREIRELIRMKPVEPDIIKRRLARCHDVGDLRRSAKLLIPRPVFDYVDGAADEELSMAANAGAFRRCRFRPNHLVDVAGADTGTRLFGRELSMPLAMAPTGYGRMMHPDGEIAVARAAGRRSCRRPGGGWPAVTTSRTCGEPGGGSSRGRCSTTWTALRTRN